MTTPLTEMRALLLDKFPLAQGISVQTPHVAPEQLNVVMTMPPLIVRRADKPSVLLKSLARQLAQVAYDFDPVAVTKVNAVVHCSGFAQATHTLEKPKSRVILGGHVTATFKGVPLTGITGYSLGPDSDLIRDLMEVSSEIRDVRIEDSLSGPVISIKLGSHVGHTHRERIHRFVEEVVKAKIPGGVRAPTVVLLVPEEKRHKRAAPRKPGRFPKTVR